MDNLFHGQQGAGGVQLDGNGFIGFVGGQTGKLPGFLGELAVAVHRDDDGQFGVILADFKVLHTETGCGVDAAGAAVQGDVVAHNHQRLAVVEGGAAPFIYSSSLPVKLPTNS